jgi:hypothetical protein
MKSGEPFSSSRLFFISARDPAPERSLVRSMIFLSGVDFYSKFDINNNLGGSLKMHMRIRRHPEKSKVKVIEVIEKGEVVATVYPTRKGLKIVSKYIPFDSKDVTASKFIIFDFKISPRELHINFKSVEEFVTEQEIKRIEEREESKLRGGQ